MSASSKPVDLCCARYTAERRLAPTRSPMRKSDSDQRRIKVLGRRSAREVPSGRLPCELWHEAPEVDALGLSFPERSDNEANDVRVNADESTEGGAPDTSVMRASTEACDGGGRVR